MYTLEVECLQNGHVYMESKELLPKVKLLLEESQPISIEYSDISNEIIKLGEESKIVVENNKVYIPSLYFSEKGIVSNIQRILAQEDYKDQFPESEFLLALGSLKIESVFNMPLLKKRRFKPH